MDTTTNQLDEIKQILNDLDGHRLYTVGQVGKIFPDKGVLDCFESLELIPARNVLGVLASKLQANSWSVDENEAVTPVFEKIRQMLRRQTGWLRQPENNAGSLRLVAK